MLRVAVFIDAGYLWKQLCKALVPDDGSYRRSNVSINYSNFHSVITDYVKVAFPEIPLLRCYWYDGSLANGNLSSDHTRVALLNDFKLRLGSRLIENTDGKQRQKGVDGLIIADLIGLAQNKVLSHALLISGDGDMVPGVGVAQALGVRIHLLAIHAENATAPALKMEVDFYESWQIDKISEFAQAREISSESGNREVSCTAPPFTPATPSIPKPSSTEANAELTRPLSPSEASLLASPELEIVASLAAFFTALASEEKDSISQAHIPYDIDRRLIRLGYECNNRTALTEKQKRDLRNKLKALAQQSRENFNS